MIYLRARYYDPSVGVFTTLDPFEGMPGRPMSLNGYSWVEGNTPNLTDATGLNPFADAVCLLGAGACIASIGFVFDNAGGIGFVVDGVTCAAAAAVCGTAKLVDMVDDTLGREAAEFLEDILGGNSSSPSYDGGSCEALPLPPLPAIPLPADFGLNVAPGVRVEDIPIDWVDHENGIINLWRSIDMHELHWVRESGHTNYGFSPNGSGKYFSFLRLNARQFANTESENRNMSYTVTVAEYQLNVLLLGFIHLDPGGAELSIHFSDAVLPEVYAMMESPIVEITTITPSGWE